MYFHAKIWKYRNEILYKSDKNREYTIKWFLHENKVIEGNEPNIRKYIRKQALEIEKSTIIYVSH